MSAAQRTRWSQGGLMLASALLVSGCVTGTSDLQGGMADRLQKSVVQVAELASAGDYSEALADLDALQAQLTAATAKGEVGGDRDARIRAAIEQVRTDLQDLIDALKPEPAPEPEPVPEPPDLEPAPVLEPPGNSGNNGNDKGKDDKGNDENGNGKKKEPPGKD